MIRAIISDADGTLVNTMYLIRHGQYEAAVEYLTHCGIPKADIPAYEMYESYINKSVGGPTRETFEKTIRLLFGQTHAHHLSKIDFDLLDTYLAPVQDRIAPLYVHPFHGLTELFSWAGRQYVGIGIFTSGNRHMIIRNFGVSLPLLGYTDLFQMSSIPVDEQFESFIARAKATYGLGKLEVATCENVHHAKPDPEGIHLLMHRLDVAPDEVIVLGDHAVDMQAAQAAGVHAIGISHGFGTPAELTEAGALTILDNLSSLPILIERHNRKESLLF